MIIDSQFDAWIDQNEKGVHKTVCPFCEWEAVGFLEGFCVNRLIAHMNEKHQGGKVGNA